MAAKKAKMMEWKHFQEQDLDLTLAAIARAEGEAIKRQKALDEEIRIAKERAAPVIQALVTKAKGSRQLVELFAEEHPEMFPAGKRSVDLPNGVIGYHIVESIKLPKCVEGVIAALKSLKLFNAITVNEKPNKDVMAALPDETLVKVGGRRVRKDTFYIRLKTEDPSAAVEVAK